ncbi:phosphatidic acid phosphatase type 2/haloperoxidase [Pyrenochaeta sp. MPI-SDFR-AT-0127]|nr:phosphatidic acid phosphatase type 2/haloperoxidase [Pyrenochaeta sp. MPI-SDFR-AT-0127]
MPHTSINQDPELGSEQPTTSPAEVRRRRDVIVPGFRTRPPFRIWLRHHWLDIATQLLCLLTAFLIYSFAPLVLPQYFPLYPGIERTEWGRAYGKPYMAEYITTLVSAVVSFAAPAVIMGAVSLWGTREFEDGNAALIGLGYALATGTLFQSFIKIFIGGLRPHFLSVCDPLIPPPIPGFASPGPSNRLYYMASQVCTGDANKVKEAQMSFPSGHSCAAFAGFGFLGLWLNAKFKIFGSGRRSKFPNTPKSVEKQDTETGGGNGGNQTQGRIQQWKLVMFAAPWCIAILLAGSKVRDEWHHPIDVLFGALVGTAFAHMAFRMVYRSVYDWRDNHIPMER